MMERVKDWRTRLSELVEDRRWTPFEWGEHDCALWATEAVHAVHGIDWGAPYRGTYDNAVGATRRLIALDGVRTAEEFFDKRFGPDSRRHVALARAGDVVAGDMSRLGYAENVAAGQLTIGVCLGAVSYFVTDEGLVALPTLSLEFCWHG